MPGDLNAGYVGTLLEQYLENPDAVDPAWRQLFESADNGVLTALPGLSKLIEMRSRDGNGDATERCRCPDRAGARIAETEAADISPALRRARRTETSWPQSPLRWLS